MTPHTGIAQFPNHTRTDSLLAVGSGPRAANSPGFHSTDGLVINHADGTRCAYTARKPWLA